MGKWKGVYGSSIDENLDYWIRTGDMEEAFDGNSYIVVWDVNWNKEKAIQT